MTDCRPGTDTDKAVGTTDAAAVRAFDLRPKQRSRLGGHQKNCRSLRSAMVPRVTAIADCAVLHQLRLLLSFKKGLRQCLDGICG
jgi:hypothetical protein